MTQPQVSPERLLRQLARLAEIGGRPDGGVDRVAGSAADLAARRWLVDQLQEIGLEGRIDSAGNVFGRLPGSRPPWLLVGSHTDTVPAGGRLDGAYGVVAAWEVLRCLCEAADPAAAAVEVVSFADEEGVAGAGLAGSGALCASPHVQELRGYLELHIEQGPRLETEGLELGVVEAIVGIERWEVVVSGTANHAGTTPFHLRRDAGRVAARVIARLRETVQAVDREAVANVGELRLFPGSPNVVPGEATFTLELRARAEEVLAATAEAVREALNAAAQADGCSVEMTRRSAVPPVQLDAGLVTSLSRVCDRLGRRWTRLVSGAGHDAGNLAAHVPAGMLFVPSSGGVSHSPLEHTEDRLLVVGAETLLEAVLELVR